MKSIWKSPPLQNAIKLEITFSIARPKSVPKTRQFPAVKPDLDNLVKLVTDSGNEILWRDDNLIIEILARKQYGEPRITVQMQEID